MSEQEDLRAYYNFHNFWDCHRCHIKFTFNISLNENSSHLGKKVIDHLLVNHIRTLTTYHLEQSKIFYEDDEKYKRFYEDKEGEKYLKLINNELKYRESNW